MSGDRIPFRKRLFATVQTGCRDHPLFFTIDTGSFLGVVHFSHTPHVSAGNFGHFQAPLQQCHIAILKDPAYRRMANDPTEMVERETSRLFQKSTLAEEVCK